MDNTLIVFASNHGAVEKCARELFRQLDGKVDICNLNHREYSRPLEVRLIIVGGSIHSGEIQEVIAQFCETTWSLLLPSDGAFISCLYSGKSQETTTTLSQKS